MRCPTLPTCPTPRQSGRLLRLLGPALLTLAVGCSFNQSSALSPLSPIFRGAAQAPDELPQVLPQTKSAQPTILPPPGKLAQPANPSQPTNPAQPPVKELEQNARLGFSVIDSGKQVPLTLDTVFRLAETQNGQTAVAREKLREAFANCDVAAKAWLPDLWVGASWYRHDGGIANEDGTLTISSFNCLFGGVELNGRFDLREAVYKKVDAERRVWQQRIEVSKLSNETLLDAASTYVDLLAARAAEGIALKMQANLEDLLKQANAIAKTLPAAEVEVARIQTDLHGQQQLARKFREGTVAAAAKLIYLLGLDPASELTIMDRSLVAFTLVNPDTSADELVAQAEHSGPGIREMESLLHLVLDANCKANGLGQFMPVFDLRVAEGGFGTGPGDRMDWDNRLDLGVQMRWNLTECVTRRDRQRAVAAQVAQAQATYQDLRAKLTMGVQESREAIRSGRDQMDIGMKQLKHANDSFERSKFRLTQPNIKDRTPSEVLLAVRALNASNLAYLMAIRDYDKAQFRLAILTGAMGSQCGN